ncbi:hypothetical protein CEXT_84421 [Caerostris extrusa]|uniref:Uncharacterized protein n=1 Tax=Caerostris extrusa TaxID=172846 RepID=A0AAV4UX42_CAEEX|nr:hypothetical protein CEXT_84421 [Caerostris extrusa]
MKKKKKKEKPVRKYRKCKIEIEASSNRKTLKSLETTRYPEKEAKYLEFWKIWEKKVSEVKSVPGKNVVRNNQMKNVTESKEKKLRAEKLFVKKTSMKKQKRFAIRGKEVKNSLEERQIILKIAGSMKLKKGVKHESEGMPGN